MRPDRRDGLVPLCLWGAYILASFQLAGACTANASIPATGLLFTGKHFCSTRVCRDLIR